MKILAFCFILYAIGLNQANALDSIAINDEDALFTGYYQTEPLISSHYIAWNANWKWAGVKVVSEIQKNNATTANSGNAFLGYKFTGDATSLGLNFLGNATIDNQQIVWHYDMKAAKAIPDAIGFGIEFSLNLKSQGFDTKPQDPVLIDDKAWQWQMPSGKTITVSFEPAPMALFFERGQKSTIRALFYKDIKEGSQSSTMTVQMSPGVKVMQPIAFKYGDNSKLLWHANSLSPENSPVDLSSLNDKPAGKHGIIKADADKLVFADGTPAKFWGGNVMAYGLFLTKDEEIKKHAQRIAKLGMNLIRIHHHDSTRWVRPNIFQNPEQNTLELSETSLKKIDWWIKCLEEEGVYVWLDMHVGREFTSNDVIDHFQDIAKDKPVSEVKGYNYFNDSIQGRMMAFNQAYLNHVNSYTGIAYKDDPGIVSILLTNENDLTLHFGNALLPNKGVPIHNQLFADAAHAFADANNLSFDKVTQTWLPGESKLFLNEIEHRFNKKLINHVRNLGYQSLISTTNSWGGMTTIGLPSLTDGDIIDTHSYGSAEELSKNPRVNPSFLAWIGMSQVSGKPLSVTEWNIGPYPAVDRFTGPLYTASIASLQGWDAIMLYGYSQSVLGESNGGSNYSTYNDPAIMGVMPAAALLYRQDHIKPAINHYELTLDANEYFNGDYSPKNSKAIRTLLETSQFSVAIPGTKELPWLHSESEKVAAGKTLIKLTDAKKDFIPANQSFVQSDTKEINRNWEKGLQTINSPKSQIVSGWMGSEPIELDKVKFNITTPKAVVAVQSVDNQPIELSKKIFITAIARTDHANKTNLPFLSESVVGELHIKADKGLLLYPLQASGVEAPAIKPEYKDGQYQIKLPVGSSYHWWLLK